MIKSSFELKRPFLLTLLLLSACLPNFVNLTDVPDESIKERATEEMDHLEFYYHGPRYQEAALVVHDTNSKWDFVDPDWTHYDEGNPLELIDEALKRRLKGKLYEGKEGNFRGYLMAKPVEGAYKWTSFYLIPDPQAGTYGVEETVQSRPRPNGNR